jgi:hypothetical protein
MAERRIINGYIVERQDDGSLVTIGPANTAPQMPIDPSFQYQGPKAAADLSNVQTNVQGNAIDNRIKSATSDAVIRKADAEAEAAVLNTQKARRDLAAAPKADAAAAGKRATMDSLVDQINRVQQLYEQDIAPETLGNFGGALDSFGAAAARFNSAGAALADQGLAAFRVPGVGAQSDLEARQFAQANTPQAGDWDSSIEEKLSTLRRRVDANRQAMGLPAAEWASQAQERRNDPAAALMSGNNGATPPTAPPMMPGGGGAIGGAPSASGSGPVVTANDQAYAGELQQAYNGGASVPQMIAIAQKYGFDPRAQPVSDWQRAIDFRDGTGSFKGQRRGLAQVQTPASGQRSLVQNTIGNAALTAPGAAALASADAGTFGLVDEAAALAKTGGGADYAAQRDFYDAGKRAAAEQNPTASAVGNIAGGIVGGMGIESLTAGGLSRLGRAGQVLRQGLEQPLVGSAVDGALYGAATGAGQSNSSRLSGAAKGGVVAGVGGVIGTGVTSGVGSALTGVRNGAVQRLSDAGVSLTPGQILSGSGIVGRGIKKLEDASESLPGVGSVIRARREGNFRDFNRAAFRDGLAPINEGVNNVAEEGVEEALDATSRGYRRALSGINARPDPQFGTDFRQAVATGQGAQGQYGADFATVLQDEIAPLFQGRTALNGQDVQDLMRVARGYARQYRRLGTEGAAGIPQPTARPVAQAFEGINDATEGLLNRQTPEVMPAYTAANQAYRNVGVLRDAVDAAKSGTQTGSNGVFTPAQLARVASSNARRFGGTQGTTRQPFYQLSRDGQDVLPSNLPNSGTFDRQISAGIMGIPVLGAGVAAQQGWIDPETALGIASLAAAYSRPGTRALQAGLVSRPTAVRNAGQAVIDRRRIGGLFGSSLGLSLAAP